MLKGKYVQDMTPENMAYEFSKWTSSFPQAYPNIPSSSAVSHPTTASTTGTTTVTTGTAAGDRNTFHETDIFPSSNGRTTKHSTAIGNGNNSILSRLISNIKHKFYNNSSFNETDNSNITSSIALLLQQSFSQLEAYFNNSIQQSTFNNGNNGNNDSMNSSILTPLYQYMDIWLAWKFGPFETFWEHFIRNTIINTTNTTNSNNSNYSNGRNFDFYDLWQYYVSVIISIKQKIQMRYSLEPILGTFDYLVEFDKNGVLWLISGVYVIIRTYFNVIQWYKKWILFYQNEYHINGGNNELLPVNAIHG